MANHLHEGNFLKLPSILELNSTLLNQFINKPWVKEEITMKIIKYVELNVVTKAVYQNPWNTAKTTLRWKFIALDEYITKEEI